MADNLINNQMSWNSEIQSSLATSSILRLTVKLRRVKLAKSILWLSNRSTFDYLMHCYATQHLIGMCVEWNAGPPLIPTDRPEWKFRQWGTFIAWNSACCDWMHVSDFTFGGTLMPLFPAQPYAYQVWIKPLWLQYVCKHILCSCLTFVQITLFQRPECSMGLFPSPIYPHNNPKKQVSNISILQKVTLRLRDDDMTKRQPSVSMAEVGFSSCFL